MRSSGSKSLVPEGVLSPTSGFTLVGTECKLTANTSILACYLFAVEELPLNLYSKCNDMTYQNTPFHIIQYLNSQIMMSGRSL
jgi:hypothetical protein